MAWETYNDPEGFENPNKYHFGVADFGRVGFELVAHIFNAEHDTHCFVLQDKPRAVSLPIVAFQDQERDVFDAFALSLSSGKYSPGVIVHVSLISLN